ncbi:hypothetical protein TRICI_003165 [Trichomonascus ciferrii]|uniref:BIR-domain-containing protein n=1 Tax=Trichomonascus ciferrii TaxID=44093 RepID=A0A642V5V2_9ASCO|nr:hypothetical protein TRICI_003165 [Trichomonascus ciferrii]
MAAAGFYFDPALDVNDKTSCFMCFVSLDGWEPGDDPLEEHAAVLPECSWVRVRSEAWKQVPENEMVNSTYNPHSLDSFNARLDTFTHWPHDRKKGWNPTSFNMAKAGFYFNPDNPDDDTASCTYCGLSLDGWEPKDEPIEEHRRRYPACLFFSVEKPRDLSVDSESVVETPTTTPDTTTRGRRSTRGRSSKRSSSAMSSDEFDTGTATKKKRASSRTKKQTKKGSKQPAKGKARLSAFSDDENQFGDAISLKPAHIKSPVKEVEEEGEQEEQPEPESEPVQQQEPEPIQEDAHEDGKEVKHTRKSRSSRTNASADDDDDDTGMVTANDITVKEEEVPPEDEVIADNGEDQDDSVIEIEPPQQQKEQEPEQVDEESIADPGQQREPEIMEEDEQPAEPEEEQVTPAEARQEREPEPELEAEKDSEPSPEPAKQQKQVKMPGAFPESREASAAPEPKKPTKKLPKDSLDKSRKKRTSAELEMEYGMSSSSASPALIPTKSRKSAATDKSTAKSDKSIKSDKSTTKAEQFASAEEVGEEDKSASNAEKPTTKGKSSTKPEKPGTSVEKSVSKAEKSSTKDEKSTSKAGKSTSKSAADKSTKSDKSTSKAKADKSTRSTRSTKSTSRTSNTRPSGMALLDEDDDDDDDNNKNNDDDNDNKQEDTHKTLTRSSGMALLGEGDDDDDEAEDALDRRLTHVSEPPESENWTRLTSYDSPGSSPAETRKKAFALNTPPKQNDHDDKENEDPEEQQSQPIQTPAKEVRIVTPPEHPKWDAADPDMVFSILQELEPSFTEEIQNDETLQDKTLVEWIAFLADRAEETFNEKANKLFAIVEEQGERGIQSVQNLPVAN